MLKIIISLLITLSGITACVAQSPPSDQAEEAESGLSPAVPEKSDEEVIAWWLNHEMRGYKNKPVMQQITKESHKFRALADSCRKNYTFLEGSFGEPFPVAKDTYVVPFYCASYPSTRVFQLFPFTRSEGLSTTPLTLSQFKLNVTNQYVQQEGFKLGGFVTYQASTQTLEITDMCHRSRGSTDSMTRYRYENDRFVLKEFWANSTEKCKQGEPLSQIYPPPK
jgi:hypothetical protein